MAEGRTYVFTWKRTESGFDLWVKSRPKIRARAWSFETADSDVGVVDARLVDRRPKRHPLDIA